MPHVITSLCLREGSCLTVCPVECIVPGNPPDEWPWFYIDPDICIDCGACVSECPSGAIFPEAEVPSAYRAKAGQHLSMPAGTPGFSDEYDELNRDGEPVHLKATRVLQQDEIVDLSFCIAVNQAFFEKGPGYTVAKWK